MRTGIRLGVLVIAICCGSLALAAPAGAVKSQQARFKVDLLAEQDTTWTLDHTSYDGCVQGDIRQTGNGRQGFSATTRKPVKVTASRIKAGGSDQTFFVVGSGATPGVPVNVAALREGTYSTQQLSGGQSGCGGGDGPYEPPPPDCGPRSLSAYIGLDYYSPADYPGAPDDPAPLLPVLVLDGPSDAQGGSALLDLWQNCPGGGGNDDRLLLTPRGGLPANKLFGDKGRFKVKVSDREVYSSPESGFRSETVMNWRVSFERLRAG